MFGMLFLEHHCRALLILNIIINKTIRSLTLRHIINSKLKPKSEDLILEKGRGEIPVCDIAQGNFEMSVGS